MRPRCRGSIATAAPGGERARCQLLTGCAVLASRQHARRELTDLPRLVHSRHGRGFHWLASSAGKGRLSSETRISGLIRCPRVFGPGLAFCEKRNTDATMHVFALVFDRVCRVCKFQISGPAPYGRRQHGRSWHARARQLQTKKMPKLYFSHSFRTSHLQPF